MSFTDDGHRRGSGILISVAPGSGERLTVIIDRVAREGVPPYSAWEGRYRGYLITVQALSREKLLAMDFSDEELADLGRLIAAELANHLED